jgi:hypothetical protein
MVVRGADMKTSFRKLVALMLFALALDTLALAQDFDQRVRANIPFNFYASGKVMPAGEFTFAVNRQNRTIAIFQNDKGSGSFLLGSPNDGSNNGRTLLTFRTNNEDVYELQKLQEPDFGISFGAEKVPSHSAAVRPADATQVVVAQLVR